MPNNQTEADMPKKIETFVEGLDYYFDKGFMVLTSRYLLNRGYCCDNGCRHCPYGDEKSLSKQMDL